MASPTNATLRGEAQLLVQDTSGTSAGFTSAQWTTLLNISLRWFYDNTEKRVKSVTIATYSDAATEVATTVTTPEILEVYGNNLVLDRMGWGELRYRQRANSTQGTATHYALVKQAGAATNTWLIALYPIPANAPTVTGLVRDYPTALSADGDVIELGDHEARIVAILAAILAAPLLGRPDLLDQLVAFLPKMLQDKMESFIKHDEIKTTEGAAA